MMIGKKHLVLAGLLIALGAAVYLNWQFAPTDTVVDTAEGGGSAYSDKGYITVSTQTVSGADVPASVNAAVSAADASADTESDGAVDAAAKARSAIEETRKERETTREEALETLQEIIEDASLGSEQKTEAVNTAADIARNMEKEASIELLIRAKGYDDCVAVISDSQVVVVVPAAEGGLKSSDTAIIRDIVVGQLDISPSGIKIIESK